MKIKNEATAVLVCDHYMKKIANEFDSIERDVVRLTSELDYYSEDDEDEIKDIKVTIYDLYNYFMDYSKDIVETVNSKIMEFIKYERIRGQVQLEKIFMIRQKRLIDKINLLSKYLHEKYFDDDELLQIEYVINVFNMRVVVI